MYDLTTIGRLGLNVLRRWCIYIRCSFIICPRCIMYLTHNSQTVKISAGGDKMLSPMACCVVCSKQHLQMLQYVLSLRFFTWASKYGAKQPVSLILCTCHAHNFPQISTKGPHLFHNVPMPCYILVQV